MAGRVRAACGEAGRGGGSRVGTVRFGAKKVQVGKHEKGRVDANWRGVGLGRVRAGRVRERCRA